MAKDSYPLAPDGKGGHRRAVEGDEYRAACGCKCRVIEGQWRVIAVCEGGRKQGVQTYAY